MRLGHFGARRMLISVCSMSWYKLVPAAVKHCRQTGDAGRVLVRLQLSMLLLDSTARMNF